MLSMMLTGFSLVLTVKCLLLISGGVMLGILFGAIPGITVTMGVALFLPITFVMEPVNGLALLLGLYIGGTSGGLISAILLRIPGTPASVATCFDGHPMAQRGEAGRAISLGIVVSFIGGMLSLVVLILVAPVLAKVTLQFGAFEYFSIALFSLTLISGLSGKSILRGLASGLIGMSLAMVGTAPISAFNRYTFGIFELSSGFSLLPVLVGLFAVSQVITAAFEKTDSDDSGKITEIKKVKFNIQDLKGQTKNIALSTAIGTGIGILPGLGAAICNILAYSAVKKISKYPEKFGTGIPDGIVASETSNNASTGGAMIPLMTLGIPGDNTTAIILAGFVIHGITPGPLLFINHGNLAYAVFAALIIANVVMLFSEFLFLRGFIKLLRIPRYILLPAVMVFCTIGAYGTNNQIFDVFVMLIFGLLGFALNRVRFPLAPIILGFILGPVIELNLRRGLMRSEGSFLPFITEPVSGVFLLITVFMVGWIIYGNVKKNRKAVS
ncbi:MAG: tripartite tricarboxylate transporter permease [Treponema sp.]|jgi:putative tricarboxylic transport membrane protein|nr:tripartite tricarboxylate transporter permease [Treponema sp.]